jgi:hypothetical protein
MVPGMPPLPGPDPVLPSPPPRRLVLRPGLRVVRRDDRHLQVGLDPPYRLVVADQPPVRRLLADLQRGLPALPDPLASPAERLLVERTLARLAEDDLLVDADVLDASTRTALAAGADRGAVAAGFAQHGNEAADRLAARMAARVHLDGPEAVRTPAARLLAAAGVGTTGGPDGAAAVLVAGHAEPAHARLDELFRLGLPHLVLAVAGDAVTLGPFVAPDLTACRRCVDAHRAEQDPRRAVVAEQYAAADGTEPCDPALLALGVAWAARDLVTFLEGDRPATWSATVRITPDLAVARRRWTRHPHCGCAWQAGLAAG